MLDSTPFLSMVDDSEMEISSVSASTSVMSNPHDISRLDKLEREVLSLNRRLEQETQSRKKLQELIQESGLNLPQDISIPE